MKGELNAKTPRRAGAKVKVGLNTAVGDRDLCAWQPVKGVVWVQTRHPEHARQLARRRDGRLVAYGVAGGFLKTFEFARPLSWAVGLMSRYMANEKVTNAALGGAICAETSRTGGGGV